jgi:hypothetical protein
MKRQGYQQGDVLLVGLTALPTGLKKVNPHNGQYLLVEGEHMGHSHRMDANEVEVYVNEGGRQFIELLTDSAALHHQTHHAQIGERKMYHFFEVERIQEIDPYTEEIREVQD